MEQEIQDIIKKNLPEQVGTVLKARLDQAEKDSETVKQQQDAIAKQEQAIKKLQAEISKYMELDTRNAGLDTREKALEIQERDFKVKVLEATVLTEQDKTKFAKDVAMGLVRNTEYRKNIFDTKSGPEGRDNYGNVQYATHTVNADEKKTAE